MADGMVLLSDGIRHTQTADRLETFFSADTERAFEIGKGTGHRGRYSFPVVLLTPYGDRISRHVSSLAVVSAGKNDWVVDKLP